MRVPMKRKTWSTRRKVLLVSAILLFWSSSSLLAQEELESTRWMRAEPERLEALVSDLFSAISVVAVADSLDPAHRVLAIGARMSPGDQVQLYFHAHERDGWDHARLHVDLRDDLVLFVRIRSSGGVFEAARAIFRTHWLPTLLEIDSPLELQVIEYLGTPPGLRLSMGTAREYSCVGFRIEGDLSVGGESLDLELFGISPGGTICLPMTDPARLGANLPVGTGRHEFRIRYHGRTDLHELVVTDSTFRLVPRSATFTRADTSLGLRVPRHTFALNCGRLENAPGLCEDVTTWIASRSGIESFEFPGDGVIAYERGPGTFRYFRYAREEALDEVLRCLPRIEDQIREAVGVTLTIETWDGRRFVASSRRSNHEPHIEAPRTVTAQCDSAGP